jgi:hypothetical protein
MRERDRTPEQSGRVEQLAKELHRHYRAAFKALHSGPMLMHGHDRGVAKRARGQALYEGGTRWQSD